MLSALFIVLSFCSVFAGRVVRMGSITLRPSSETRPIIGTQPTIDPFNNPSNVFSLYAIDGELELTSESAIGTVQILVYNEIDVVYSDTQQMSTGSEIFISVEDFPTGAYTISILYNATIYVGEFEVE